MPTPERQAARWVIRDIAKFLKTYEPPIEDLPLDRQPVAHMMWGWWVWLSEQALLVAEAKRLARVAALVPVVRSVGEHADLMLWLHSVGAVGIPALHAAAARNQQLLFDSYAKENGQGPAGVSRQADPPPPASLKERDARRTLRNVEERMDSFEGGVPYYIYRLTSGLVHPGVSTSSVYAWVDEEATGYAEHEPSREVAPLIPAALQDCAIRSCQAAFVFRRELAGGDALLSARVQQWATRLDQEDQIPTLRLSPLKPKHKPSSDEVRNASKQLRDSDYEAVGRVLKELASDPLAGDSDPVAIMRSIKELRAAAKSVLDSIT